MAEERKDGTGTEKTVRAKIGTVLEAKPSRFDRQIYERLAASGKAIKESRPENSVLVGRIPERT